MEIVDDRADDLKSFDESKAGVKGLVDSGVTAVPRFFIHPPEILSDLKPKPEIEHQSDAVSLIPTIDLSGYDSPERRPSIVEKVKHASSTVGFFQIINHGVPLEVLDRSISSIKAFHEQPAEIRAQLYRRTTAVSYFSNVDLFKSTAASWRDTLQIALGPQPPNPDDIPEICRKEVLEWDREISRLAEVLMDLLSEGLGLSAGRLRELSCGQRRVMVGHYYPQCPQPDLTVGIATHTDPGILTVLLQDNVGGLQIKSPDGGHWIAVAPVPGSLVINIGDLLQIISNDEYRSVQHRVLANPHQEPRVSIAIFYNPSIRDNLYGPLPELVSPEKPPLYRHFSFEDFLSRFFSKELDGKTLRNFYRI